MLTALRVAVQVPAWLEQRQEGRVHSVFARACNLAWGDDLISLVLPEHGMVPGGVAVQLSGAEAWGLCPGKPVRWDDVTGLLVSGSTAIRLSGAEPWQNRRPLDRLAPPALLAARMKRVAGLARQTGRGTVIRALAAGPAGWDVAPTPENWGGYAVLQMLALCQDVQAGSPGPAGHLGRLLGLGEGLTPSGDDFLIGLLALLHYGGAGLTRKQAAFVRRMADEAAERAPRATTPVSANYLRLAARGSFSERAEGAALALLAPEAPDPLAAAATLMESGHSSGTDTLVGLLCGIHILLPESSPWPFLS